MSCGHDRSTLDNALRHVCSMLSRNDAVADSEADDLAKHVVREIRAQTYSLTHSVATLQKISLTSKYSE